MRHFKFLMATVIMCTLCTACSSNAIKQTKTEIELNSKTSILDCFSTEENQELTVDESNLDESKIGSYKVTLSIKGEPNKKKTFTIKVVDTTPPQVELASQGKIVLTLGESDYNLEKYFTIKDNSPKKDCTISIDDSAVDVNTLGIYEVSYVASDASGNKTEGQVDVEVIEPMEDYEKIAVNLIDSIRDILKNPESLQIHSMECCKFYDGESDYHFKIDLSAQNGFGGMNRKTYYIETSNGKFQQYDLDEFIMSLEASNYKSNYHVLQKQLDVDKILRLSDK